MLVYQRVYYTLYLCLYFSIGKSTILEINWEYVATSKAPRWHPARELLVAPKSWCCRHRWGSCTVEPLAGWALACLGGSHVSWEGLGLESRLQKRWCLVHGCDGHWGPWGEGWLAPVACWMQPFGTRSKADCSNLPWNWHNKLIEFGMLRLKGWHMCRELQVPQDDQLASSN